MTGSEELYALCSAYVSREVFLTALHHYQHKHSLMHATLGLCVSYYFSLELSPRTMR
jgi:hypothetical protein